MTPHIEDLESSEYTRQNSRNARIAFNSYILGSECVVGDYHVVVKDGSVILAIMCNYGYDILLARDIKDMDKSRVRISCNNITPSVTVVRLLATYYCNELVRCGISGYMLRYGKQEDGYNISIPVSQDVNVSKNESISYIMDRFDEFYFRTISNSNLFPLD